MSVVSLAACGSLESGPADAQATGGYVARQDMAVSSVANPSTAVGGTIKLANVFDYDSIDPGNTYESATWAFNRLYARTLMMFKVAPGAEGSQVIPDIAERPGTPSDDLKTWTYRLRSGVKFEDGTKVTSQDIKFAIARTLDKDELPYGPTYFNEVLDLNGYEGPFGADGDLDNFTAIETPDERTIIFHLNRSMSNFDYLMTLPGSSPVPADSGAGAEYGDAPLSTGPYRFETVEPGVKYVLVRNEHWSAQVDQNRTALPDRWELLVDQDGDVVDNGLLDGTWHLDGGGLSLGSDASEKVVADQKLRAHSDSTLYSNIELVSLNGDVAPLDNEHCRKAILWAVDRNELRDAAAYDFTDEVATNLMPRTIRGSEQFDLYPRAGNGPNIEKAKEELALCGKPDGFEIIYGYGDTEGDTSHVGEALKETLAGVGITVNSKNFMTDDFDFEIASRPAVAAREKVGMAYLSWSADFPDGYGMLSQLVDSRVRRESGGSVNYSIVDPEVNALVDSSYLEPNEAARNALWSKIDRLVMERAYVLPLVWSRGVNYRGKDLTNVMFNDALGQYDWAAVGLTDEAIAAQKREAPATSEADTEPTSTTRADS